MTRHPFLMLFACVAVFTAIVALSVDGYQSRHSRLRPYDWGKD